MFKRHYIKIKKLIDKYEKYLSPLAMAFGFVVDNITLQRIDLFIENMVIITYLSIAIFAIIYLNTFKKKLFTNRFLVWLNLVLPFVLQIVFGGLFSAFMVFYSRSATLFVSWPFILILLGMLFGNELFRKKYERLTFHLSILYLAIFAYSVFAVPVLLGRVDMEVFLASGGVSLLVIAMVILILHRIDHKSVKENKDSLLISIMLIYFVFNILYFTNIIPPIPLAMKEGGVYHSIVRSGANYNMEYEKPKWYEFLRETAFVYHHKTGKRVYIFSRIFAPTKFKEQIYHQWSYYDEAKGEWIEKDRLSYSISGGRDGGYRGYTYKSAVTTGKWRVDVETDRGQVLGRVKFEVRGWQEDVEVVEQISN